MLGKFFRTISLIYMLEKGAGFRLMCLEIQGFPGGDK